MSSRASGWLRHAPAQLLFVVASVWLMYPVFAAPDERLLGWAGDNVQYVYLTGRIAEALARWESPFWDPNLNFPDGLALAATDTPFLSQILISPVTRLTSPVAGYNALLFASSFLTGVFTYAWIARMSGSRIAGIVAGLAFVLAPYRVAHGYGHLQMYSTQCLPIFFAALTSVVQNSKPTIKQMIGLAVSTALVGAMSQYYLVIAALCGAIFVVALRPDLRFLTHNGGQLALAVLMGGALSALPYLGSTGDIGFSAYSLDATRFWSASPDDFFVPSRLHPFWGEWVERVLPRRIWVEHTVYVGVVALVLASVAMSRRSRRIDGARLAFLRACVITSLAGALLALGTDLHWSGVPLQAEPSLHLPMYYLSQLPGINLMRVWSRFAVIPIFFVAVLAGLGSAALLRLAIDARRRALIGIVCIAAIAIDFAPGRLEYYALRPRAVDKWLEQHAGGSPAAFLPPAGVHPAHIGYDDMYGSLVHDSPMPAFNHPTHQTDAYRRFFEIARRFPERATLEELRSLGLRYLVLRKRYFDGQHAASWADVRAALVAAPDIAIAAEVGSDLIVDLRPLESSHNHDLRLRRLRLSEPLLEKRRPGL